MCGSTADDSLIERVESMLADPGTSVAQKNRRGRTEPDAGAGGSPQPSQHALNQTKDALLDSPQVLNFISGAVVILCDAIKADLQKADSGVAQNLRVAIQQVGENL